MTNWPQTPQFQLQRDEGFGLAAFGHLLFVEVTAHRLAVDGAGEAGHPAGVCSG